MALQGSQLKIALIDKAVFPRHKTCGDAIPGKTQKYLRAVWPGIDEALAQAPFGEEVKSAKVYATNGLNFQIDWRLKAYNMTRADFDNLLFEEVKRRAFVDVIENCAIGNIQHNDDGILLEDKEGLQYQTKIILGCDGANSICAKELAQSKTNRDQYGFAVAAYYAGIDCPEKTNLIFILKEFNPGYFWVFPLGESKYNVGYGMLGKPPKGSSLKDNLKKIIHSEKAISAIFKKAEQVSDVYAFGLPMGGEEFKPIVADGMLLCGDAASLIDPLQGHGIDKAVRSGILAAQTAVSAFQANDFSVAFLNRYQEQVQLEFGPELKKNYKLMKTLGNKPWILNSVSRLAQWKPMEKALRKLLYG